MVHVLSLQTDITFLSFPFSTSAEIFILRTDSYLIDCANATLDVIFK